MGIGPRGTHEGVVTFHFNSRQVYLVAADSRFAKAARTANGGNVHVFTSQEFLSHKLKSPQQIAIEQKKRESMQLVAGNVGESCDTVPC